jgi:NADH dehydrogenase [ubiquinone] 1 alpha subcomplex assembly factor 5
MMQISGSVTSTARRQFRNVICRQAISRYLSTGVFDRKLKRRQRDWSLSLDDSPYYDYLRKESAARLVDRIEDIYKSFPMALELGCHRGHVFNLLNEKQGLNGTGGIGGIETLIECDVSPFAVQNSIIRASERSIDGKFHNVTSTYSLVCDEEFLPFKEKQFDIVLSNMNLHWVNDLPSALKQIKDCLKPDGVFLCSILGGSTLEELRRCFYLAEQERKGGMSPHASPFARASDLAALMQGAEFQLPTVDVDTVKVRGHSYHLDDCAMRQNIALDSQQ